MPRCTTVVACGEGRGERGEGRGESFFVLVSSVSYAPSFGCTYTVTTYPYTLNEV